ncbi:hypothetical protein B0H13DRAFT_2073271 [Mycena leptocephala]|nr:hypothetical protein B0H13DRAFT_2073271 [Mycena leptocephala]
MQEATPANLTSECPSNDECGYYFVDHSKRVIFWLDVFDISTLQVWDFVPGIETSSHVKMALEIEYWMHYEYFPVSMPMSSRALRELRDTIIYSVGDAMTSPTTTLAYPADYLFRMLTLTTEMSRELTSANGESTLVNMNHGSIAVLARFMKEFARKQFFNFHGEKTARLNNDQSVYGYNPKRTYLITLISPLLFNAPLHHLRTMEIANMDQLINFSSWHQLITRLRTEWQELVLYVLASWASICFGLGSIILGIILVRKYRSERPDVPDLDRAAAFFQQHGWTSYGLEALSIVHSLPYALMIWGMITFILAFLFTVFQTSSIEIRGVMLATVVTVCLAIMGFIWTEKHFLWDRKIEEWWMNMKLRDFKMCRSKGVEGEQKLSPV